MSDRILIVDDEPFNVSILAQELADRGYSIDTAPDGRTALGRVDVAPPNLIVLDYMMPELTGLDVLRELRRRKNETPVVMITAHGTVERAVQAMKEGAYDFVTRPFEADHMAMVVSKALERERLRQGVELLSDEVEQRHRLIVGGSARMRDVIELAQKAAKSRATVLLLGESGTGKEIFARSIHHWSERRDRPFVAINSVGLTKELLESELFGHERGAFTGANRLKKGKIEIAHGGTVFLDEIGDISLELQTKLLRFLEEREFERVGGTRSISVDIRIIAATNRDLVALVKEGVFREDLFHRLNVVSVEIPPLRERREDIPVLSGYFLEKYSMESGRNFTQISEEARTKLFAYDWPGNVRELANVIERAVVLGVVPAVGIEDLPGRIVGTDDGSIEQELSYYGALNAARRDVLLKALSQTQGNRAAAAKTLGLNPKYFFKLMKSLGID